MRWMFLCFIVKILATVSLEENIEIDRLKKCFEVFENINDDNNKAVQQCLVDNNLNCYIHVSVSINHVSSQKILQQILFHVLSSYCKMPQFNSFNLFQAKIIHFHEKPQKLFFCQILQLLCKLALLNQKISFKHIDVNLIEKIRYISNYLCNEDDLNKLLDTEEFNFFIIENCIKTEDDFSLLYNALAEAFAIKQNNFSYFNFIFAIRHGFREYRNQCTEINLITNLENFFRMIQVKSAIFNYIVTQSKYRHIKLNSNECIIGNSYLFNTTCAKLCHYDYITCGNSDPNHEFCFNIRNRFSIEINLHHNDKYTIGPKCESQITCKYCLLRHDIVIKTVKETYHFYIITNFRQTQKEIDCNKIFLRSVSIYYRLNTTFYLFGRFCYFFKINSKFVLNNQNVLSCYFQIIDNAKYDEFVFATIHLLNLTFGNLSDFLPIKKDFLDCVYYEQWFNIKTDFFNYEIKDKKVTTMLIRDLLAMRTEKNPKFEIINVLGASYKFEDYGNYQNYNGNLFNIMQINKILKISDQRELESTQFEFHIFTFRINAPICYYSYLIIPNQKIHELMQIICVYNSWMHIKKVISNFFMEPKNFRINKNYVYQLLNCYIFTFSKQIANKLITSQNISESVESESVLNSFILTLNQFFTYYEIKTNKKDLIKLNSSKSGNCKNQQLIIAEKVNIFIQAHLNCPEILEVKAIAHVILSKYVKFYKKQWEKFFIYERSQIFFLYSAILNESCYNNYFLKNYISQNFEKYNRLFVKKPDNTAKSE